MSEPKSLEDRVKELERRVLELEKIVKDSADRQFVRRMVSSRRP